MNLSSFNSCFLKFLLEQNLTFNHSQSNQSSLTYDDVIMAGLIQCRRGEDDQLRSKQLIRFYLNGVAGLLVSTFGLAGNLLSFIVLSKKSMSHSSTYCYLSALSVFDFFFILCSVLLHAEEATTPPNEDTPSWLEPAQPSYYPYFFPYLHPMAFFIQVASIWLTLAFTVDRYIMICLPFKSENYCTLTRARKVICVLTLICFLFNLPKFFEYRTVKVAPGPISNFRSRGARHTSVGDFDVMIDLTPIGQNIWFKILYHSWFYVVFVSGVPFVILFVLNGLLISTVRSLRKRGKQLNPGERKRTDTTIMLISVVVVFFVCQTPALVSRVLWAYQDPSQAFNKPPFFILNELGNFLILFNSSINIIPYYFFSKRFREEFTHFISCGRCRHGRPSDFSDTNYKSHHHHHHHERFSMRRLPNQRSSLGSNMCYAVETAGHNDILARPVLIPWWRARPSFVCR